MNRREMLVGAPAIAISLWSWSFSRRAAAQTSSIEIGVPVESTNYLPLMLAVTLGFFKEAGVEAKVFSLGGGSNLRSAVASRQLSYAAGDVAHPLAMTGAGRKAKVLLAIDTRATVANIMVRSDLWDQGIRSLEALGNFKKSDGSKPQIAVTRIGSATWLYGNYLMSTLNLVNNVNFVSLPDGAGMVNAMRSGKIDALVANPVTYFAVLDEKVGRPIFDTTDKASWDRVFGSNVASQCLFALDSQIKDKPQLTQAVVDGVYRGLKHIEKHSAEQLFPAIEGKFLPKLKPQAIVRELAYMKAVFDFDGTISEEAYRNGGKIWFSKETKIAPQPYAEMVDFSFLNNAKRKYG